MDGLAGYIAGFPRRQIDDSRADIAALAHPARRDALVQRFLLCVGKPFGHRGGNEAGCDAVHRDTPAPPLLRTRLGTAGDPRLRRPLMCLPRPTAPPAAPRDPTQPP